MTPFDERFNATSLRALLALAVVFIMLATTGWTAVRPHKGAGDPRAAALSSWLHGSVAGHKLPSPAVGADSIAYFFTTLTAGQTRQLANRYPLVVGNLDGAPVSLRYLANRVALAQTRVSEIARSHSSLLTPAGRMDADKRARRYASLLSDGRQILAFDPSGAGRAAEVFGDLASADRVALVVPGVDTDISTFERTAKSYAAPVGMARALYTAERTQDPSAKTAVIAWANYTTPSGVGLDASTGELAEQGAVRLNSLVDALPAGARVSLFCHSYGSVLCGVAAPDLPQGQISDITVFGSPGMRVNHAEQLHTSANVWAARDPSDWIGSVPHLEIAGLGHGADPVSESFGARVIGTEGALGHPGYFAPGAESLANFTDIALGHYGSVQCAPGREDCASGLHQQS
ncbi:alpha/beta hydrolase [Streptomyces sp. H10-C2]|uniref:alpha/beta hydrolase n=1 Tax=unclassified Streptomyces TaxID=2593676 RepID=UPI0024BB2067|nr:MULTISPECIES: alpha/beta hydrolase [unclassified Streptomyces]MDJ0343699.1 alpha/beta hydrolase [Streptomyces sp. PH10-H1]MDJ0372374.1 alpha/beta hydrolase [Streptomyces sp. H10-C2]